MGRKERWYAPEAVGVFRQLSIMGSNGKPVSSGGGSGRQKTVVHTGASDRTERMGRGRTFPILAVLNGEQVDARFVINQPEMWLGRSAECEICVTDSLASRRHGRIVYENIDKKDDTPVCRFIDNDSTNGTRVNGEPISDRFLQDRDRIAIGKTLLGFFLKDTYELDADARLFRKATTDALTGLKNRRMFDLLLAQEFARARRYDRVFSLVMMDIDHFKAVNDTYGHQAGDEVLKWIGRLILERVREQDSAFRYGGEELAVVAPETAASGAKVLAEHLRATIQDSALTCEGRTIRFTASFGVAAYDKSLTDAEALLANADKALYRAKESGRNRVVADGE